MQRLLGYIRRYRLRYAFGTFCTFATATLAMVIPYLIRDAINGIERGRFQLLPRLTLAICVVSALMGVARWFSRFVIFNCGRDIEYEMRKELFGRLLALGPDFYERVKTGDLMSRMINDLTAVRMLVGIGVLTFISTPLYYLYASAIMFSLNPRLTVASLAPYLVLFVGIKRLTSALMERSLKVQEGLGAIGAKVQESLSGIHVVKAYTLEDHEAEVFRKLNEDYNEQGLALARLRGALMPLIRAASAAAVMVVLIYGGSLVMAGRMTVGDLVAFMVYLGQLAWPTTGLGWVLSIYQRGRAAMKRLEEIFSATGPQAGDGLEPGLQVVGEVEWERVWLSYFARPGPALNGEPPYALKDVNVKVPAGGKLAIVGRTGAGKSTMVKLLVRLLEPTKGRVLLDGRDVRQMPLATLRRAVGVVPQEPLLFSDTIARNVALGRRDAGADELWAAAVVAGLEGELATLPLGLETVIGERGTALSGGQKQRVALARAIAYKAPVVVLDDALSSVDSETEATVLRNLAERERGHTTIVVAHRASTVRGADQIIVLEQGAVVESGTHEELMAAHGIYADLFKRQLLEEELAEY